MAQPEPRVEETAPAAGAPMVRLESVKKSFGDLVVLDGIDLTVDQGEVLVVIGPVGAEKARCSAVSTCSSRSTPGRIFLEGEEITAGRRLRVRQRIGIVFQQFNLFPHLKARSTTSPWRTTGQAHAPPPGEERAHELLAARRP